MSSLLKISEAASLAMHTTVYLAGHPGLPSSVHEIASALNASEAHLAKVLQRLVKFGLVRSYRGPKGGFTLARDCEAITLLEIFEAIEGPIESTHCLFDFPVCQGRGCIMGDLLSTVHRQVETYFSETRLSDLVHVHWRMETNAQKNSQN